MSIKLENLKILYDDMVIKGEQRAVFPFTYNAKAFSCIFLIDTSPYSLYLTTLGKTPITIEWEIDNSFVVSGYIEKNLYYALLEYLNLKGKSGNPFKPITMLEVLDRNTPTRFKTKPTYKDVLKIAGKTRKIEESSKIYFCGWKSNPVGKNVSPLNLEKTERAFGTDICQICKLKNISSCWTDIADDEKIKLLNEIHNY